MWGGIAAGLLSLCCAQADTSRIIVQDDFESFRTTKTLRATWSGGPAELMTNAPGGGRAAVHDGTGMNRRSGFFVFPDATHNLVLQADFYDFGTNADQNVLVSINGEDTHLNVAFGLKGPHCYVARVGGFSSKTNWIPFKQGQLPVPGWHHFKATVSATNLVADLDFGSDGAVDRTLQIPFSEPPPTFTQVRFGGYSGKLTGGGTVLVDNIKLEIVALEPSSIASKPSAPEAAATNAIGTRQAEPNFVAAATKFGNQEALSAPTNLTSTPLDTAAQPSAVSNTRNISTVASPGPLSSAQPANPASRQPAVATGTFPAAVWWISTALVVIIGLLGTVILMLRRQGPIAPRALLSESAGVNVGGYGEQPVLSSADDQWRKRALQAEAMATQQAQILGEKVGPELVEFAKESLVQGLYTQRNALIETQLQAKQTLNELEARLAELHLPANERIRAFEKRIGELEKELESRGDEMRELTRATLLLVQQRLDQEREQQTRRFN
jgi:hypothetical protein